MADVRAVIDANVLVRALTGRHGSASKILTSHLGRSVQFVATREIDDEYANLLKRRSIRRLLDRYGTPVTRFFSDLADIRARLELVTTAGEAPPCRDDDDRKYLHCARDGRVPFIVTFDKDLLESTAVPQTRILTPEEFVRELNLA